MNALPHATAKNSKYEDVEACKDWYSVAGVVDEIEVLL